MSGCCKLLIPRPDLKVRGMKVVLMKRRRQSLLLLFVGDDTPIVEMEWFADLLTRANPRTVFFTLVFGRTSVDQFLSLLNDRKINTSPISFPEEDNYLQALNAENKDGFPADSYDLFKEKTSVIIDNSYELKLPDQFVDVTDVNLKVVQTILENDFDAQLAVALEHRCRDGLNVMIFSQSNVTVLNVLRVSGFQTMFHNIADERETDESAVPVDVVLSPQSVKRPPLYAPFLNKE